MWTIANIKQFGKVECKALDYDGFSHTVAVIMHGVEIGIFCVASLFDDKVIKTEAGKVIARKIAQWRNRCERSYYELRSF